MRTGMTEDCARRSRGDNQKSAGGVLRTREVASPDGLPPPLRAGVMAEPVPSLRSGQVLQDTVQTTPAVVKSRGQIGIVKVGCCPCAQGHGYDDGWTLEIGRASCRGRV